MAWFLPGELFLLSVTVQGTSVQATLSLSDLFQSCILIFMRPGRRRALPVPAGAGWRALLPLHPELLFPLLRGVAGWVLVPVTVLLTLSTNTSWAWTRGPDLGCLSCCPGKAFVQLGSCIRIPVWLKNNPEKGEEIGKRRGLSHRDGFSSLVGRAAVHPAVQAQRREWWEALGEVREKGG